MKAEDSEDSFEKYLKDTREAKDFTQLQVAIKKVTNIAGEISEDCKDDILSVARSASNINTPWIKLTLSEDNVIEVTLLQYLLYIKKGSLALEICKMEGVDLEVRASDGATALMFAAESELVDVINFILEKSPDTINYTDKLGMTALHSVAKLGNEAAVNSLIKAGADIDARDNDDRVPLLYAVSHERKKVIPILIEAGADVNIPGGIRGEGATTLLHMAAISRNIELAKALIKAGANVGAKDTVVMDTPFGLALKGIFNHRLKEKVDWDAIIGLGQIISLLAEEHKKIEDSTVDAGGIGGGGGGGSADLVGEGGAGVEMDL